jgi:hypothetical protein
VGLAFDGSDLRSDVREILRSVGVVFGPRVHSVRILMGGVSLSCSKALCPGPVHPDRTGASGVPRTPPCAQFRETGTSA